MKNDRNLSGQIRFAGPLEAAERPGGPAPGGALKWNFLIGARCAGAIRRGNAVINSISAAGAQCLLSPVCWGNVNTLRPATAKLISG